MKLRFSKITVILILILSPLLLHAQDKLALQWPVAKKDSIFNSLGTPLATSSENFSKPDYFHQGLDIISPAGSEVFSPIDADKIMIVLNEDYNIHLFVQKFHVSIVINHLSKNAIPKDFKNLETGKIYDIKVKKGQILGVVEDGYESYMNHVHLEVRSEQNYFLNPLLFFSETNSEKTPPTIVNTFLCNQDNLVPIAGSNNNLNEYAICVEAYDTVDQSLKTVSYYSKDGKPIPENQKINPKEIIFSINGEKFSSIDFSIMQSDCNSYLEAKCHYQQTTMKPDQIMFVSDNKNISSIAGSYVALEADDIDSKSFDKFYFGRRYIYKSTKIPTEFIKEGANQIQIQVIDAASNSSTSKIDLLQKK